MWKRTAKSSGEARWMIEMLPKLQPAIDAAVHQNRLPGDVRGAFGASQTTHRQSPPAWPGGAAESLSQDPLLTRRQCGRLSARSFAPDL